MKKFLIILTVIFLCFIALVIYIDISISSDAEPYIVSKIDKLPKNNVGLVLGTSKYLKNGKSNPFFYNRLKAAKELYSLGKVKYLILSGDNKYNSYNEPRMMKQELMKMGVPDTAIYMDFAGFRTFDSVIRCRFIFGQIQFTIISQDFHLERAVFIARYFDIPAIGYEAAEVGFHEELSTRFREYFARLKVFWDIYTGYKPKFLGEKIRVE